MSDVRELLIRGSEKVIGHYRLLLASAKPNLSANSIESRIEREQRLLDGRLLGSVRGVRPGTGCSALRCRLPPRSLPMVASVPRSSVPGSILLQSPSRRCCSTPPSPSSATSPRRPGHKRRRASMAAEAAAGPSCRADALPKRSASSRSTGNFHLKRSCRQTMFR